MSFVTPQKFVWLIGKLKQILMFKNLPFIIRVTGDARAVAKTLYFGSSLALKQFSFLSKKCMEMERIISTVIADLWNRVWRLKKKKIKVKNYLQKYKTIKINNENL